MDCDSTENNNVVIDLTDTSHTDNNGTENDIKLDMSNNEAILLSTTSTISSITATENVFDFHHSSLSASITHTSKTKSTSNKRGRPPLSSRRANRTPRGSSMSSVDSKLTAKGNIYYFVFISHKVTRHKEISNNENLLQMNMLTMIHQPPILTWTNSAILLCLSP